MSEGQLLGGRYRRERMIGAGAMGQVWLAEDTLLNRMVAIKNVVPSAAVSGMSTPEQDDLLARINREARLAARMSHPNAVAVYDLVTVDDRPHVVMEYVAGVTLAEEIRSRGVLPLERVAALGAAVADALADAHELGIVHRDVKPANILLDRRGQPKLADFGIARVSGDGTATGVMLGTPAYLAPEVAGGAPATGASDVWSLAITLYAAIEGATPFESGHDDSPIVLLGRVLTTNPQPPPHGGELTPVLMRMLARDPQFRPSAAEVAASLRRVTGARDRGGPGVDADGFDATTRVQRPDLRGPAPAAPPVTATLSAVRPVPIVPAEVPPADEPGRRRVWPYLVAAACAVALVVAGALVFIPGHHSADGNTAAGAGSTSPTPQVRTETRTHTLPAPSTTPTTPTAPTSPSTGTAGGPAESASYDFDDGSVSMSVTGPAGFVVTRDTAASTAQFHNFVYEDASAQTTKAFLHIGVGDRDAGSFDDSVRDAVSFQQTRKDYTDREVQPTVTTSYCGVDAADIEFTGTNDDGVARHGEERIWISHGEVLIVQINAPESEWARWAPWFDQMVSTCVEL